MLDIRFGALEEDVVGGNRRDEAFDGWAGISTGDAFSVDGFRVVAPEYDLYLNGMGVDGHPALTNREHCEHTFECPFTG